MRKGRCLILTLGFVLTCFTAVVAQPGAPKEVMEKQVLKQVNAYFDAWKNHDFPAIWNLLSARGREDEGPKAEYIILMLKWGDAGFLLQRIGDSKVEFSQTGDKRLTIATAITLVEITVPETAQSTKKIRQDFQTRWTWEPSEDGSKLNWYNFEMRPAF